MCPWLCKGDEDHRPAQRTVRLGHEIGFAMLITDLDRPLEPKAREETLDSFRALD
jgi:hypothetical protein